MEHNALPETDRDVSRAGGEPKAALATPPRAQSIGFAEAFRVFLKIGLLSFGGPAGQIALMHRILVEEKRWIDERSFLHALNYCMLLPGPEAQQLATYVGWRLFGIRGGLMAGLLFVVPGALVILALSFGYVSYRSLPAVEGLFLGIKAAVLAIVLQALVRIGRRVLKKRLALALAGLAFLAIFALGAPFPLIIASAALLGLGARGLGFHISTDGAHDGEGGDEAGAEEAADRAIEPTKGPPFWRQTLVTAALGIAVWLGPVALLGLALGRDHVFTTLGLFFSKVSVLTFGGAYAVLSYVAEAAVMTYGWLLPGEMLDGLGLAETTPGPLILVVQFVGFLAASRNAGTVDANLYGVIGSLITIWVTFAPCFLWIFVGAPYIEALRANRALTAALAAITAAVVGVILNLSVWFALHVLFRIVETEAFGPFSFSVPDLTSLDWRTLVLSSIAVLATFVLRLGTLVVLAGVAGMGLALTFLPT